MDRRLLHLYNVELQHLRQTAGEFAREYPKIAGRLALDKDGKEICPDPFVERLLEGFAFLAARVHLKLDAEFPRFTQALLETIHPNYLAPMPSMAIVRFEPDLANKALATGFTIPRGSTLRSFPARGEQTPCMFRTAHEVKVWPIRITEASYLVREASLLKLPETDMPAAFRLTLEASADLKFSQLPLDRLTFFLRGTDELPGAILEHLLAQGNSIWVRASDADPGEWRRLPYDAVRPVGFSRDESLLPNTPVAYEGYGLLTEYFAFPQRFHFFEIAGLKGVLPKCEGAKLEIAIGMSHANVALEDRVHASAFELFCTPVVNLFEKRTDRVPVSGRFPEYHVVVDRTRPLDYEVFAITSVTGYGADSNEEQAFQPFYLSRDMDAEPAGYYTVHRTPRMLSEKERKFGKLSSYGGSEVYVSLVDDDGGPSQTGLQQLAMKALCTNRHLPLSMNRSDGSADFAVEFNGPVRAARCLAGPTPPRATFAAGNQSWRLISQLTLNYFSLTDTSEKAGAEALRELLNLYIDPHDRHMSRQVEGIRSVKSQPVLRRMDTPGVITFGRGIEVTVVFDEDAFAGSGIFVLGMVLEHFFARLVSLNSFTETVIRSRQRGEIIRWPARLGKKAIL